MQNPGFRMMLSFRIPYSAFRISHIGGPWLAACISSVLYVFTLAPGFSFGDSGELIAGAATLGIVHPPGYCLFLLAGRLFVALPIPGGIAWRLNLFTALWGACAVSLLCLLLKRVLLRLAVPDAVADISALAGALLFAFSQAWWSQCVVTEVYTLQVALEVGLFLALERARLSLAWFLGGLSVIAHPSSVLVLPLCVWMSVEAVRISPFRTLRFAALLGLGLSPALYVYLRGTGPPWQDWGQIRSLGDALVHLTRRQYGGLAWHPYLALGWMLKRYLYSVLTQWTPISLPIIVAGLVILRRWKSSLSDLWLVLFALTGPLAIVFLTGFLAPSQRVDFEPFCLLSYLMLAAVMAVGLASLLRRWLATGLFLTMLLLGLVCVTNGPRVLQAGNTVPEEYAELLVSAIPRDAVVAPMKDSTSYALDYAGAVRRIPTDISIQRFVPGEERGPVKWIEKLIGAGHVVVTDLVPETWPLHVRMKPNGFLMEVCHNPVAEPDLDAAASVEAKLAVFQERVEQMTISNPRNLDARVLSTHFVDLAVLLEERGRGDESRHLLETAIAWNPRSVDAHIRLADRAINRGQLDLAQAHLSAAIDIEPYSASAYVVRGRLRLAERDVEGAVEDWERARRIDPTDSFSRLLLAKAYLQMGDWLPARKILLETLRIDPDNLEARRLLPQASQGSGEAATGP
jgi:Tfp pilus assembly protein PilF